MIQNSYKVKRTFFIQNQLTSQSEVIDCQIDTDGVRAQILPVFKGFENLQSIKFKIFDNDKLKFVNLQVTDLKQQFTIPYSYVELEIIMIKWRSKRIQVKHFKQQNSQQHQNSQSQSSISSASSSNSINSTEKKQRNKQRTIGQVIKLVKQWRDLHLNSGVNIQSGKKNINLQQAAKILGISRKSLDDYYYHLRVGQLNNFPFKDHLNDKIGVLRKQIKGQRGSKSKKSYHKHPKNLKIINKMEEEDQLMQQNNFRRQQELNQDSFHFMQEQLDLEKPIGNMIVVQEIRMEEESQDPIIKSYQNKFMSDFEFLMDQPDPFFNFQKSFHKKNNDVFFDPSFF